MATSGGGGDTSKPDGSSHHQQTKLPKPSSDHPKPSKIKKYRPKKTENLTVEEKNRLAAKARNYRWLPWSPRRIPAVATIPCIPHVLCAMHGELLKSKALPMDDIFSQLPCTIVGKKRFNLKAEKGYLLYGKRYMSKKNPIQTDRKFVSEELKDNFRWRDAGVWEKIAAPNGSVAGMHFHMNLECLGNLMAPTEWTADEYLSVTSEAGESSLVVLRCVNPVWNSVEAQVEEVEDLLLGFYQQLMSAEHKGAMNSVVEELKSLVFDTEIQLGCAITKFENTRNDFKASQDLAAGVQGGIAVDDSLNLELSLAIPGADSCSGDVSAVAVTPGAYFVALNGKKVQENMRQSHLLALHDKIVADNLRKHKQNQKGFSSAADDNSAILVEAVPADNLVPDRDVSVYASRHLEEKREQAQRSAKGKEKMQN